MVCDAGVEGCEQGRRVVEGSGGERVGVEGSLIEGEGRKGWAWVMTEGFLVFFREMGGDVGVRLVEDGSFEGGMGGWWGSEEQGVGVLVLDGVGERGWRGGEEEVDDGFDGGWVEGWGGFEGDDEMVGQDEVGFGDDGDAVGMGDGGEVGCYGLIEVEVGGGRGVKKGFWGVGEGRGGVCLMVWGDEWGGCEGEEGRVVGMGED